MVAQYWIDITSAAINIIIIVGARTVNSGGP